ncbi:hypothetical protein BT63DRAFT_46386 [Microthyrium microscopicum]|uniref:Diphthamide biosynthesis protein 4 n=1 Tax=Microthyrium microscopicum TaxID=703497 RepID=A0A6A6U107_9PEZI|nr:hypothetical protein BT63DRAFT_46386 [Microthyrium microscopicum]
MNYYQLFDYKRPPVGRAIPPGILKRRYHDALLKYHPDKLALQPPGQPMPSIDEIKLAYQVLRNTKAREAYDKQLLLHSQRPANGAMTGLDTFHIGEEVIDLDDMVFNQPSSVWTRGCRCGEPHGFQVTEKLLDTATEEGCSEVVVGCIGCSLWIRVGFVVEIDAETAEAASTLIQLSVS